ncbi:VOC family protein [Sphingobium boeckii]|uniref:Catechol 2,3-dioxygenase-like lactoylglutathione lyase family enzyme n=1 Tax=Sphingobium boeckii TaxID=1082345 RepID=A0A7W9EG66_9SPHN|nr:VOC family protein [Sphingobium boeckii]MBB5686765.1 catechol 2,3-dioxygenase-like lactoylglutathione lyase family enzyme [Sphingobium boeckii]
MIVGRHYQNAYVTRNVDKAVAQFRARADVRTLMEIEVPVKVWTPKGEGTGVQKLAFVWVGDLNYELIEPKDGDVLSIYRDALAADDRLVFHHVCHMVDDWDAFIARVESQPFPIVLKGGTPGMLEFVYLDTREWLGHYTEYVWMVPERWAAMGGR